MISLDIGKAGDWIQAVSGVATAAGVILAFRQLQLGRKQAMSAFEDGLTQQYREIIAQLPVDALLGKRLAESELVGSLGSFYRYFDLSNEQAFLRERGRVCAETWADWKEGMQQNLALPAFQDAWRYIRRHGTGVFDDVAQALDLAGPNNAEPAA